MWISLFSIAIGCAIGLAVGAVILDSSCEQLPSRRG
jgi:hypothetical protein